LERGRGVEGVCLAILTILTSCSSGKKFVIQQIGKLYENITEKLYKLRYISSKVSEKLHARKIPLPPRSPTILGKEILISD
jgi:hypothetical protein